MTVDPAVASRDLREWFDAHVDDLRAFAPVDGESLDERVARGGAMLGFLDGAGVMGRGWPPAWAVRVARPSIAPWSTTCWCAVGSTCRRRSRPWRSSGPHLPPYAPELAAVHVPRVLAGHELWCQGFSEPDAGSDLASLRTRADRSTDGWVIKGQKVWTSLGHLADFCGVLARTGTPAERHRGLTLFWVDMRAQGVSTRTIQTLTGEDEFAEVFLDDVAVDDCLCDRRGRARLGGRDAPAAVRARHVGLAASGHAPPGARGCARLAASASEVPVETIGHAFTVLSSVRARSARTIERLSRGDVVGPEVSIDKILLGRAEQAVNDVVRLAHGRDFARLGRAGGRARAWGVVLQSGGVDLRRRRRSAARPRGTASPRPAARRRADGRHGEGPARLAAIPDGLASPSWDRRA